MGNSLFWHLFARFWRPYHLILQIQGIPRGVATNKDPLAPISTPNTKTLFLDLGQNRSAALCDLFGAFRALFEHKMTDFIVLDRGSIHFAVLHLIFDHFLVFSQRSSTDSTSQFPIRAAWSPRKSRIQNFFNLLEKNREKSLKIES